MWGKSGQRSITLMKMLAESEEQPSVQTTMADFVERQSHEDTVIDLLSDENEAPAVSASDQEEVPA